MDIRGHGFSFAEHSVQKMSVNIAIDSTSRTFDIIEAQLT